MVGIVRSELLKIFTTRMWWGMAIGTLVAGGGFAALWAWGLHSGGMAETADGRTLPVSDLMLARSVYTGGVQIAYLLTLVIGVLCVGAEYRHKTISATLLATPKRWRVMLGKVVALLLVGVFYGLISLAGSVGVGALMLNGYGVSPFPAGIWRTLALALLVLGLWALIGLGAGILIPNQLAALLISVGFAWIVEPILGLILVFQSWGPAVAKFLPGMASSATTEAVDMTSGMGERLSWWAAALVLAGYAAFMSGLGTWLTSRRDVG